MDLHLHQDADGRHDQQGDRDRHRLNGGTVTDDDTATVNVINPAIHVTKSVNHSTIYSGGSVTYTIKVKNTGDDPLTAINTVDDKCSPLSAPSGDTGSDNVLSPGEEWTYTCTKTLTADTTNKATATGTDSNGGTVTDDDTASVNVINPAIHVTKSVNDSVIYSGQTVTYTIKVKNTGDDPLTAISTVTTPARRCRRPRATPATTAS